MTRETLKRTRPREVLSIERMAIRRLRELLGPLDRPSKLIRFPVVFERICATLCLSKKDAWQVLHQLDESGHIELVPFQGIRLLGPHPTPQPGASSEAAAEGVSDAEAVASKRVLAYLKRVGEAYPSDIAVALDLDIDIVFGVAKNLLRDGRIEL